MYVPCMCTFIKYVCNMRRDIITYLTTLSFGTFVKNNPTLPMSFYTVQESKYVCRWIKHNGIQVMSQ